MKVAKKSAIIIAAICLVAMFSTACAAFLVTSEPTSPVTVEYAVKLTEVRGFNPSFKLYATVIDGSSDGGNFVSNVPVTFYADANGAGWTAIGTSKTNSTGVATFSYSIKSNGEKVMFQASAGIS